jgi:hypothetical protein
MAQEVEATEAYRRLWSDEAGSIVAAFERSTRLSSRCLR